MITALIIDDEPHCVNSLTYELTQHCPDITLIGSCQNGPEGIISIRDNAPSVVFLDIEMPMMNGLQLLEYFKGNINFQVIFTTAHDGFAARAFRLAAVDYLIKPIDGLELKEAVAKVKRNLQRNNLQHIDQLQFNVSRPIVEQRIALPHRDGYDFVKVKDITYCRANGAYTYITLISGKEVMLSRSLGEVTEMLPPELFERIHHSTLVNVQFIKQLIKKNGLHVVMEDNAELMISKSKKEAILLRLGLSQSRE